MLWFVLGLILGFLLNFLITGIKTKKFQVRWYQWVLGVLAAAMILFTLQNYFGFQKELESHAGNFIAMTVGIPALILLALIWVIPLIGKKVKGKSDRKEISV